MAKAPLRAVQPGEAAKPRSKSLSVSGAVKDGTHRDLLMAMLERAAERIDDPKTPAAALAALMRQAHDIEAQIRAIDEHAQQEAESAEVEDAAFDAEAL